MTRLQQQVIDLANRIMETQNRFVEIGISDLPPDELIREIGVHECAIMLAN